MINHAGDAQLALLGHHFSLLCMLITFISVNKFYLIG